MHIGSALLGRNGDCSNQRDNEIAVERKIPHRLFRNMKQDGLFRQDGRKKRENRLANNGAALERLQLLPSQQIAD